MALLYGYKWTSVNGEEFDHETQAGQLWIRKTKELSKEEWFKAVDRCEQEVREKTRIGDESWPPSYEEFIAYATEHRNRAHKLFTPSLPQPPEIRSKRKRLALESLDKIKSMLDE